MERKMRDDLHRPIDPDSAHKTSESAMQTGDHGPAGGIDLETVKAIQYAEKLLEVAISVVRAARVDLDEHWAKNPKVIALTLLSRSISNFRAAIRLVQQRHVMESRTLVRCIYENLLWMGALREHGSAFVQDMIRDEAFNRKALGELTLKLSHKHGRDVDGADSLTLRGLIKNLSERFPQTKKLRVAKTAAASAVELTYVEYQRLSLDAVHCSVTALGRHLSRERLEDTMELIVNVEARTTAPEMLSTVLHACRALMGAAIGANELLGFTAVSPSLTALVMEFEQNSWQRGD
jgi:hypothetical protein